MKAWLVVAALLTLVVCAASAALRLSQAGVGCQPWPVCQPELAAAALSATEASVAPVWHEPVRLAHRVSASVAGLMYLLALLFGWSRWSPLQRAAGVGLLVISFGLAWLGRYTPSDKPVVVIGNLLGGHLLLALLTLLIASLAAATRSPSAAPGNAAAARSDAFGPSRRGLAFSAWGLLVLIGVAQIALGALVSVRAAGAACQHGCSPAALLTAAVVAFDPTVGLAALPTAAAHALERQAVLSAHIALGVLLLVLLALAGWRARSHRSPAMLALATTGLGTAMALTAYPLGAAVVHSLLAAATLCAAVLAWHAMRSPARAGA